MKNILRILNMRIKTFLGIALVSIVIFGCAQPNDPIGETGVLSVITKISTSGYARDFAVSDEVVFVAEDQRGFSIYNYLSGTLLCHRDTLQNRYLEDTWHLAGTRYKDLSFVFDTYGTNSLNVYDVSNLQNPAFIETISGDTGNVQKMMIEDNPNGGVDLFWTSNNELKFGTYTDHWEPGVPAEFPKDVVGFDFNDTIYAAAAEQYGIHIVDRSNGELLYSIETPGEALDVKIVDNYLIAAIREEGFTIYQIEDSTQPVHIVTQKTSDLIYTVDVENDFLVLSSHAGGVIVYDISAEEAPRFVGSIDDSIIGYTFKATIENGKIFASTRTGFYVIEISE